MKKSELLKKQLFQMIYQWGRVGVVVDETAPAYQDLLIELLKALEQEKN